MTTPHLDTLANPAQMDNLLSTLLEPTPILHSQLVPSVLYHLNTSTHSSLSAAPMGALAGARKGGPPESYQHVLGIAYLVVEGWGMDHKLEFLGGHAAVGETKGLSEWSEKEQGGETSQVVFDRLAHLNKLYSKVYPGLPYITFVNHRPRSAIVTELESALEIPHSPVPLPADYKGVNEPALDSPEVEKMVKGKGDLEYAEEVGRAVRAVFDIAKGRLAEMGLH